jgi:hypothetical protein
MAARVYANINDLTNVDFTRKNPASHTATPLQTFCTELDDMTSLFTSNYVSPLFIFWMLAQT